MKLQTKEEVIKDFENLHGDKYNYSKVDYKNNKAKVIIICKVHGDFLQTPNGHKLGKGCARCSKLFKSNTEDFIEKAKIIHNNKYNYSLSEYVNNKVKLKITCQNHGVFTQSPNNHLNGKGCPHCANLKRGYSRTDYIEQANGKKACLYLIECSDKDEKFYKIGITFNSVNKRYCSNKSMPYKFTIVFEKMGDPGSIWDTEKNILRKFKSYKHSPKISFKGQTECFNKYLPVDLINKLKIIDGFS